MPETTELARTLRWLRTANGLSQKQTAERLNEVSGRPTLSRHEISRWERADRRPGRYWLGQYAKVFDVSEEVLLGAASEQIPEAWLATRPAVEGFARRAATAFVAEISREVLPVVAGAVAEQVQQAIDAARREAQDTTLG